MLAENWFDHESLKERQARILLEHRKANGTEGKMLLHKIFPPGFYIFKR